MAKRKVVHRRKYEYTVTGIICEAVQLEKKWEGMTEFEGVQKGKKGDWLVYDGEGAREVGVWAKKRFAAEFEPIGEERRVTGLPADAPDGNYIVTTVDPDANGWKRRIRHPHTAQSWDIEEVKPDAE